MKMLFYKQVFRQSWRDLSLATMAFLSVVSVVEAATITNDVQWYDDRGIEINASMGQHITIVGDTYYWVGSNPTNDSIHLYKSKTFGSDDWTWVRRLAKSSEGTKNVTLLYNPNTDRYVLIGKGIWFYESDTNDVEGTYTQITPKVNLTPRHPGYVANDTFTHYESGGMSAYREGNRAFIIVSMKCAELDDPTGGSTRFVDIFELNEQFTGLKRDASNNILPPIVSDQVEKQREAFWLFKRNNIYYMSFDGVGGWMGSDCYYRTAPALEGPWYPTYTPDPNDAPAEIQIGMNPFRPLGSEANRIMRSHASQHRWIMKIGEQWVYGGDRYPLQEVTSHPVEKGRVIMCPIDWDENGHPTVRWEGENTTDRSLQTPWSWEIDGEIKPFRAWANLNNVENGPDSVGDKEGDEDGDGLLNLMEFALGGNPLVASEPDILPTLVATENGIEFRYRRRSAANPGVSYMPQTSSTLLSDSWVDAPELEIGTETLDEIFERVTAEISVPTGAPVFIRLEVSDQ
ncbi:hypothetical protein G0Q06_03315 [Puniceicoccales bacterium CK1056]|uniref:Glycosyl hydrolase family 43 n=1 Tax=Oceanipulchritudo coccoides TaxID=2706888 RepID=A0A6B2LYJ4_9BACT|nr:hypothetical protein [Oceanipulchritudo coccoides]NDV61473.1 hypothetical protein [Oceanipulchritudo coccoides]